MSVNVNPGIEYELAFGLAIGAAFRLDCVDLRELVDVHPKHAEIASTAKSLAGHVMALELWPEAFSPEKIESVTQDDSVGPADLLVHGTDATGRKKYGLSIKFAVPVSRNPSGRQFLETGSRERLLRELNGAIERYRVEMESRYGSEENWFRRRRRSATVDAFLGTVAQSVADSWNAGLLLSEKQTLANSLTHLNTPVPYRTVRIDRRTYQRRGNIPAQTDWKVSVVDESAAAAAFRDVAQVKAERRKGSHQFVYFTHKIGTVAKMQVKFNNGILEGESLGQSRPGEPLASWNFELCPIERGSEILVERTL